jgi:hypothetical protein
MTFWDFIHSAVNDLFSENRYELYGQLWTLLVKLCDYGFSNYCQRATSNFSFKDHVEAFWEFLLAYMNLSFVIKDGPMIIERQLPSLTSIMEKVITIIIIIFIVITISTARVKSLKRRS